MKLFSKKLLGYEKVSSMIPWATNYILNVHSLISFQVSTVLAKDSKVISKIDCRRYYLGEVAGKSKFLLSVKLIKYADAWKRVSHGGCPNKLWTFLVYLLNISTLQLIFLNERCLTFLTTFWMTALTFPSTHLIPNDRNVFIAKSWKVLIH